MILVVAEHRDGVLRRSAAELVSLARGLSRADDRGIAALVVGTGPGDVAEAMAELVGSVIVVRDPRLEPPRAETMTRAVAHVATEVGASVVLIPHSRAASSYGPRVAVRLGGAYVENATAVEIDADELVSTRATHLARFETRLASRAGVTVISLAAGATEAAGAGESPGTVREIEVPFRSRDLRLEVDRSVARGQRSIPLEEAEVVVCGGRGLQSAAEFDRQVVALAKHLGAAVGVTRAVVDAGWRTFDDLVGQTGKSVAPALCVTLGVSGAAHFVSGVSRARVLVAVNTDPEAPIFRAVDYGIVGDVRQIVPALMEELSEAG